jgi:tyrosinase
MRTGNLVLLALQAASSALAAPAPSAVPSDPSAALAQLEALGSATLHQVEEDLGTAAKKRTSNGPGTCTLANLKIRREWSTLSSTQKKAYTAAVKCLMSKPALTPGSLAPGAKTRFDDFVSTHINQTMAIHYTGNFLVWHRYYTWVYEKALQVECGYTGTQPYWNWGLTAITGLETSPHFDGSDTSLSGNGVVIPNQPDLILGVSAGLPPQILPPGTGGGCVTSGPFVNYTVNMGPAMLDVPGGIIISNPAGPFAYNPRCFKRDLTTAINRMFANASSILNTILPPQNIADFQMKLQGVPGSGDIGIHGGGHFSLGGDPGRDFFISPGDPAFYLHHAMIDRVWWIWQQLSPSTRAQGSTAVAGTRTFLNNPPSDPTSIEDIIEFDFAGSTFGPPRKIKDLLSTTSGPFCYAYL